MLDGVPISSLGATGLLAIAVLLILTGRLVPSSSLKAKELECEKWRLAFENEKLTRKTSDSQTSELLEVTKTTYTLVSALFELAEEPERTRQGGAHRVVPSRK
jgi:hypothetical protein